MRHEKISIKWKIFGFLLSYVLLLLVLLWVFQTVYLDVFYRTIKTKDLEEALSELVTSADAQDFTDQVTTIAQTNDISILITDKNGVMKYSGFESKNNIFQTMSEEEIRYYTKQALASGDVLRLKLNEKFNLISNKSEKNFDGKPNNQKPSEVYSIALVQSVTTGDGEDLVIFVNSVITPVDATVHTLRIQLVYITIILIILSLVLALLISRRVSKSIIRVNDSAKELAKGNFKVKFNGNDYKEIAELSKTLNKTAEELSKTEALQRELIANVSHDLRTPLTMITAYSEVMRDLPGENNPENVQVVIDEAKRLTNLVNDLLDISKIQAGVSEMNVKHYDITESIKAVIGRYSKLTLQDGYKIDFEYTNHIEVEADEYKIFQVIYNLINNAIHYTGEDKRVTVRQIINGEIVRIEVIDTGEGISKENIESVWERYYKIDKEHKQSIMGTGLGLSIVKNILKIHQAKYGVTSVVGEGSTFWFELKVTFPKHN